MPNANFGLNLIFKTASLIDKWQWHFWIFDTETNYTRTHIHLFKSRHFQNVTEISILFCSASLKMTSGFPPLLSHPSTSMMIMAMAEGEVRARVRRPKYQNEDDCDENEEREFYVKNTFWWRRRRLNEERACTVLVDNGGGCVTYALLC